MTHWERALESSRTAHAVFALGDMNGAVNRAYYAMFEVAWEAVSTVDPSFLDIKSHAELVRQFSKVFVLSGAVSPELGRAFSNARGARWAADYSGEATGKDEATEMLQVMDKLLSEIERVVLGVKSP